MVKTCLPCHSSRFAAESLAEADQIKREADALLAQAGGKNVFADAGERYPTITLEELVARDPERIFLCTEPFPFKDKHIEELAEETGLARDRFSIVDGEYLSWHGSRTPDGIDYAENLLM